MYKELREKRKKKKISVNDIASIINKSPTTYSKKERGELPITIDEAKEICNFLKCSPLIFFK